MAVPYVIWTGQVVGGRKVSAGFRSAVNKQYHPAIGSSCMNFADSQQMT